MKLWSPCVRLFSCSSFYTLGWGCACRDAGFGNGLVGVFFLRITEYLGLAGTSVGHLPQPPAKGGSPRAGCIGLRPPGLEYFQRGRLHNLPGQPGPGLCHPQREEVLPRVQLELPLLQFGPVAPCPVTGHHWKESGPVLLTPTLQIFRGISKGPLSAFSSSGRTSPAPNKLRVESSYLSREPSCVL